MSSFWRNTFTRAAFLLCFCFWFSWGFGGHRPGSSFSYTCIAPNTYVVEACQNISCNHLDDYPGSFKVCLEDVNEDEPAGYDDVWLPSDTIIHQVPFCEDIINTGSPCTNNSDYNWYIEACYSTTIVLDPALAPYNFFNCEGGGRPNATNSSGNNGGMLHISDVNGVCNNSAYTTTTPSLFYCKDSVQTIEYNVVDPDGDSLYFFLGPCYTGSGGDSINYNAGLSGANPFISTIGWNIDQSNGNITFQIPTYETGPVCLYIEEWRDGNCLDTIVLDAALNIVDCDYPPPAAESFDTTLVAGDAVCISVPYDDDYFPGRIIIVNDTFWDQVLFDRGATFFTNSPPTDADLAGLLCWDPPCGLWGTGPHTLSVAIQDNACPINHLDTFEVNIYVKSPFLSLISGEDTLCEWAPPEIYSTPAAAGHDFTWTIDGGTINSGNGTNSISVSWGAAGIGTLDLLQESLGGCDTIVSFQVIILPKPTPVITPFSDICEYTNGNSYSTPNEVGHSYNWTVLGGTPGGTTNNSVNVSWLGAGIGNLLLYEVIDSSGCDSTVDVDITINIKPDPVINFNALQCEFTTGNVFFTSSIGPDYDWSVVGGNLASGDGTNSIFVDWPAAGPGIVSLHETNVFGCDTAVVVNFVVRPKPDPNVVGPTVVCEYTENHMFSTPTSGPGFVWEIIGGDIQSGGGNSTIFVEFYGEGVGQVILTETTPFGCDTSETLFVTINPKPDPNISGNITACENDPGSVFSTNTPGPDFNWTVVGGDITLGELTDEITVTWGPNGAGQVSLQEINGFGCDTTEFFDVTILPKPNGVPVGLLAICEYTDDVVYNHPGSGPNFDWVVIGGDIVSGDGTPVLTVDWGIEGAGTITVTETNAFSCDTTAILDVLIHPNPDPSIIGENEVCAYSTNELYSTASLGPNFDWTVVGGTITDGDGTNAITVDWDGSSIGSVTLLESNGFSCDTTVSINVTVRPNPTPVINGSPIECELSSPHIYSAGSPGPDYLWTINGGSLISGQGNGLIQVAWGASGGGEVVLTETNAFGCDTSETLAVILQSKPAPVILGPTTLCENFEDAIYTTTGIGPDWFWTPFGGSIVSGQGTNTVTIDWGSSGIGSLTLIETNADNCDSTVTINITLDPNPTPSVIGASMVCEYTGPELYYSNSPGPVFAWEVNGGIIIGGLGTDSIEVYWQTEGVGEVILMENNAFGCSISDTFLITIRPRPEPVINGLDEVCEYTNGEIYSTPTLGPFFSWTIDGGAPFGSVGGASVTVNWGAAGIGNLELNELNLFGCDTTVNLPVIIHPKPNPVIVGDVNPCEHSTSIMYSTATTGPGFAWGIVGGTIMFGDGSNTILVDWDGTGPGSLTLTETNPEGCDTTVTLNVFIGTNPNPIIAGDNLVCEFSNNHIYSTSSGGPDYDWDVIGGTLVSGGGTSTIIVNWGASGAGTVSLTETNVLDCDTTVVYPVTINPKPDPNLAGLDSVCIGDLNSPYLTTTLGPGFFWTISGGDIAFGQFSNTVFVDWNVVGLGSVTLTETNGFSCDSTESFPVEVSPTPVPIIFGESEPCAFSNSNLYYTTSGGPNYAWSIVGGVIDSGLGSDSVYVSWLAAGVGSLTLNETNAFNCSADTTLSITIDPVPTPLIVGTPPFCEYTGPAIYSTATLGPDYDWEVFGGSLGNGQGTNSVEVYWDGPGAGQVVLTETNASGCSASSIFNITIDPKPDPSIIGNTAVCEYTGPILYSSTGPGPTYLWNVNGDVSFSGQGTSTISVNWGSSGIGTVTLTETNGFGCDTTVQIIIGIDPKPNPDINGPAQVCELTSDIGYSTSSLGPDYDWSIINGNILTGQGTNSVTVNWGVSGVGTLSLHETNSDGCDTTELIFVTINPKPDPAFNGVDPVCEYTDGHLYTATSAGPNFLWSVDGGDLGPGQGTSSILIDWGATGVGELTLTETNAFTCDSTESIFITIHPKPDPVIVGPSPVCEFSNGNFYSTASPGPGWAWGIIGGTIVTGDGTPNVFVNWGASGPGILTLTETNADLCDTTVSINVTINPKPVPVINGPVTVCEFTEGHIYNTPSMGPGYDWTVVGGTVVSGLGTNSIVVDWDITGVGVVTLTDTNASMCDSTVSINVTIDPKPDPVINGPNPVCEYTTGHVYSTASLGPNWTWNISSNGTIVLGGGTNTITVDWGEAGAGQLTLTELNGSGCDTMVVFDVTVHPRPDPVIVGPDPVCEYTNGHIYSTASLGPDWNWGIIGGVISGGLGTNSIMVNWGAAGVGTLTLNEVNSLGCDTTVTLNVTINPKPNPDISDLGPVCEYTTGQVYSTTSLGPNYDWEVIGGDLLIGDGTNSITVDWGISGIGQIILHEDNGLSCDTSETLMVTIHANPEPSIVGDLISCELSGPHTYTSFSVGPTWAWTIFGGAILSGDGTNSVEVQWGPLGIGILTLTETNADLCDTTVSINVTINPKPVPVINGPVTVCEFTEGHIYNTPSMGPGYDWTVVGGTVVSGLGTNSIVVDWDITGVGVVTLTDTNASMCDSTVSINVTIDPKPDPVINGPNPVCEYTTGHVYSTASLGPNWTWNISSNGTIVLGGGTNTITVDWGEAGAGQLTLTELNGSGCDTMVVFDVTVHPRPDPVIVGPDPVCEYTNGHIYSTASLGPDWNWGIIGGVISGGLGTNSIMVNWGAAGVGTLTLNEVNSLGCDTTVTLNVTINPKPNPDISDLGPVCEYTTGQVYSTTSLGPNYDWEVIGGDLLIGDGTNSITVDWGISGIGQIILHEDNGLSCDTSETLMVTIHANPEPSIVGDLISCELSGPHTYTSFSVGPTWAWTIFGGAILSGDGTNSVEVQWGPLGIGTLTLTETNADLCDTTVSINVTINPKPVPVINGPVTVCEFTEGHIYNTPSMGPGYDWTVVGGTVVSGLGTNSIVVDWDITGVGVVTLTDTNASMCDSTVSINVTIDPKPDPVINGPNPVCEYTTGHVYSTASLGPNWTWNISSNGTIVLGGGTNTITVDWGEAGAGQLTLTELNGSGCDTMVVFDVTVHPRPDPVIVGPDPVCEYTNGHIYSTASLGPDWNWGIIGGVISGGLGTNSIMVNWGAAGVGTLTLNEVNSLGCDTTVTLNVTINPKPNPDISDLGPVCEYTTGQVYSTTSLGPNYDWEVIGGDLLIGDGTNSITVDWGISGIGQIILHEDNGLSCDTSETLMVTIHANPEPSIVGDLISCELSGPHTYTSFSVGPTWAWTIFGGAILSGDGTNSVEVQWGPLGIGILTLTETNADLCDTTVSINVTINPKPVPVINGPVTVCEFTEGHIYNTPSMGPGYDWTVVGGTVVSGLGTNSIVVDWDITGVGVVTLTDTNASMCDSTVSINVTIDPKPDPVINGPNPVCEYTTGHVYSTASLGPNWTWNISSNGTIVLGGGTNTITVDWGEAGAGQLTLTELNGSGCDTMVVFDVTVHPRPEPTIVGDLSVCEFTNSHVYISGGAGPTWNWSIVGGVISGGLGTNSITVNWGATGIGSLSLEEINGLGCDTTISVNVVIQGKPTPSITGEDSVCEYSNPTAYSTSNVGPNFNWSVTGGNILAGLGTSSIIVQWDESGAGTIELLESNGFGCDSFVTMDVIILDNPSPTIVGPDSVCELTNGVVYTTFSIGPDWTWSLSGGNIISGQGTNSITVNWGSTGLGVVSLNEGNLSGCDTTLTTSVIVLPKPNPQLSGPLTFCEGSYGALYTSGSNSGNFSWLINGGVISGGNGNDSILVTWGSSGPGSVQLTLENGEGCDSTEVLNVTIDPRPQPSLLGPVFACEYSLGYGYSSTGIGPVYNWEVLGGVILDGQGTDSISVMWQAAGIGTIQLTEINAVGCDTLIPISVTIRPKPVPVVTGPSGVCSNSGVQLYSTTSPGPIYNWNVIGGTITSGLFSNTISVLWGPAGIGTVEVLETNPEGCDSLGVLNISISGKPNPIIVGMDSVCEFENSVNYSVNDPGPNFNWTITGGTISTGQGTNSILVDWGINGAGDVIIEVENANGCDTIASFQVEIGEKPDPSISGPDTVCFGTVDNSYTSFSAGPNFNWTVNGGVIVGGQGTSTVEVQWTSVGLGIIALEETNLFGCDTTEEFLVTIGGIPSPGIIGSTAECENTGPYAYVTTSSGPFFDWTVSGGAIISGVNTNEVLVDWGPTGAGLVSLIEENTFGCRDTHEVNVAIHPGPIASISGPNNVCENTENHSYSSSGLGPDYLWTIQGGTIVSGAGTDSIVVEWGSAGGGQIWVTETNGFGCTGLDSINVLIDARPIPVVAGPNVICEFTDGHIYSTTSSGPTWTWSIVGGNIVNGLGTNSIVVNWGPSGPAQVILDETNLDGCDSSMVLPISINVKPNPVITGQDTVCEFTHGHVYTSGTSGPGFDWNISGGTITNGLGTSMITVSWDIQGSGTLSLHETNGLGCDTLVSLDIVIDDKPDPILTGPTFVCENTVHTYNASSFGPIFNWNVVGGIITSGQGTNSIEVTWATSGTGLVLLTEENVMGCEDTTSLNVTIQPRPIPFFTGPSESCEYTGFNNYVTPGSGPQYNWTIVGGFSMNGINSDSVNVYWNTAGVGSITYTETNSLGCDSSISQNITIHPKNDPDITGPLSLCEFTLNQVYSTSSPGPSFNWTVIGGTIGSGIGTSSILVDWDSAGIGEVWIAETNVFGCDTIEKINVQINPLPTPIINGPDSICQSEPGIIYSTNWALGHTYSWNVVGGSIVGPTDQSFVEIDWGFSFNGFVNLLEIDTATGCSTQTSLDISISPRPIVVILGPDTVCERTPGISYSVVDVPGDNYQWNVIGGDVVGGSADSNYIEVMWSNAGIGLIQLTQSRGGCDSTVAMTVVVRPRPTPFVSGADSVCEFSTDHWYSTPSVVSHSYFWTVSGGTMGTVGTSDSISMNWGSEGPGWVEVQETNIYGCDSVYRKPVVIMPHPDPVITPDSMVCEYTMGHFYCTPESQGDQYFWSVSGGTIDGTDTINCVYIDWLANGIGNVTLTQVSPFGCDTTISKDIIINLKPEPMIGPLDPVCENSGNHVYCTEDNATSIYEWIVDGGSIVGVSDSSCVVIDWDGAGVGHLEVWEQIITNGCDTLATADIVIHPRPDPMILGIDTLCEYSVSGLWTPLVSGNSYNWNLSTGTVLSGATTDSVTMYWDVMGPLEIMLTETIDTTGCDTTIIDSLLINPRPIPVISGADSICELSEMMTYSIAGSIGSEYHWSVMGGWIIGPIDSNVITVNWGLSGAGSVTVTEIYPECDSTVSVPVTIMPRPNPGIAGLDSVCERSSGVIYSTPMNVSETYFWNVTGGVVFGTANSDSVVIDWGETGMGEVSLNVLSDFGCDSSLAMNVALLNAPEPSISPDSIVCSYSLSNQYCTPSELNNEYSWNVSGGNIIGSDSNSCVFVDWAGPGIGNLNLYQADPSGCDTTIIVLVDIFEKPTPVISGPDSVCENTGDHQYCSPNSASSSFFWTVNGGQIVSGQNSSCVTVDWDNSGLGDISVVEENVNFGCEASVSMSVNINPRFIPQITGQTSLCSNSLNQSYFINQSGPYSYTWTAIGGNITSGEFSDTVTIDWGMTGIGEVSVLVIDTLTGCSDPGNLSVDLLPFPDPQIIGIDFLCEFSQNVDYQVDLVAGSNYLWQVSGGTIIGQDDQNSILVNWDSSGMGTVSVLQGLGGCESTDSHTVTINEVPVSDIFGPDSVCAFDSMVVYSVPFDSNSFYNWTINGGTITSGSGQNEIIVAWDSATTGNLGLIQTQNTGCESVFNKEIVINPNPIPSIPPDSIVCEFDRGDMFCSPYHDDGLYNWSVFGGTIVGPDDINCVLIDWGTAGPALLTVTETNEFGCSTKDILQIDINLSPTPLINQSLDVCENTGGHFYCTDNNLSSSFSWNISGGEILGVDSVNCVEVSWFGDGNGILTLSETIQETGCSSIDIDTVSILSRPRPIINGDGNVCAFGAGDNYFVNSDDNWIYQWQVAGGIINGSSSSDSVNVEWNESGVGILELVVTDSITGCDTLVSDSISITSFFASIDTISHVKCAEGNDGFAMVNIAGGVGPFSYVWNTLPPQSGPMATGLESGSYMVYVEDSRGCKDSSFFVLTEPQALDITLNASDPTCGGADGAINALVTGGTPDITYFWTTNPAQTQNPAVDLLPGSYSVFIQDNNGCVDSATTTLTAPNNPMVSIVDWQDVSCFGLADGSAQAEAIGANPPFSFEWNTNPANTNDFVNFLSAGSYSLTVTDVLGCKAFTNISIGEPTLLGMTAELEPASCHGNDGSINVSVTGGAPGYTFVWDPDSVGNSPVLDSISSGLYTLEVVDSNGCSIIETFALEGDPSVVADFTSSPEIPGTFLNPQVTFEFDNLSQNALSYLWEFSDGTSLSEDNPSYSFGEEGSFCVSLTAFGNDGCIDIDSICGIELLDPQVEVTNTITPNGDGENDYFVLEGIENFPNCQLTVFNRWGNMVYEKHGYLNDWNGINGKSGNALPAGSYYYVLTLEEGQNPIIGYVVIYR